MGARWVLSFRECIHFCHETFLIKLFFFTDQESPSHDEDSNHAEGGANNKSSAETNNGPSKKFSKAQARHRYKKGKAN